MKCKETKPIPQSDFAQPYRCALCGKVANDAMDLCAPVVPQDV